ncbi:MAG: T9SS type A sorting domain-containing protein [Candidatus Eisenbacteria sp.]|nr:T9SS type A sorting domain-containing protein [Candidatus Eisenbacteria bacterium]
MRVLIALGLLGIMLFCSLPVDAADRSVVMEHFTNAGCGPCYTHDPWIKEFVASHEDLVVVSYHVSWPWSGDPFYQANITENNGRKNFYNVTGVPHIRFNGNREPVYPYTVSSLEALYASLNLTSPAVINLSGTYTPARGSRDGSGTLIVEVIAEQSFAGDDKRIVLALCENGIHYSAPNGIQDHYWVMRDMIPDHNGIPVDLSGPYPDTVMIQQDFVVQSTWNADSLYFAAMLQIFGGYNKIRQGAKIDLGKLTEMTDVASGSQPVGLSRISLGQNFPNPCNPTTVFPVTVADGGPASLTIFGVEGRQVRDVFAARLTAGIHSIEWDGRDNNGVRVASGIYYARFEAMDQMKVRKLVVIR